jgi:hypothetical protein
MFQKIRSDSEVGKRPSGWLDVLPAVFAICWAGAAQAGPAMFSASLVLHAAANDYTAGSFYPYSTYVFTALPVGRACGATTPNTASGASDPGYCTNAVRQAGQPATGSGTLSLTATGTAPVPFALPQSALGIAATGSFRPRVTNKTQASAATYVFRGTSAAFVNGPGAFFAGGGPGNKVFQYPGGAFQGGIQITAGPNRFGGAMGLLGQLGVTGDYIRSGQSGQWAQTHSWNLAAALGGSGTDQATAMFQNTALASTETRTMMATGFGWTTGAVLATARVGAFTTLVYRTGYDHRTAMGLGNIQLVTPMLTHWIDAVPGDHTAQIGILKLQFVPEPAAGLLLAAGAMTLTVIRRVARRRPRA